MAKSEVLFVRVSPEDKAVIEAHAAAAGLGVAEYMRRKALEGDTLAARVAKLEDYIAAMKTLDLTNAPCSPPYRIRTKETD